jgi:hypothetical protein
MNSNQQRLQAFVINQIAPWIDAYGSGPLLTQETARRFEAYLQHEAISYVEQQALMEVVATVLGAGNPATPFVVAGLKQVLDANTPYLIRLVREHQPEATFIGVCVLVFAVVQFGKS